MVAGIEIGKRVEKYGYDASSHSHSELIAALDVLVGRKEKHTHDGVKF